MFDWCGLLATWCQPKSKKLISPVIEKKKVEPIWTSSTFEGGNYTRNFHNVFPSAGGNVQKLCVLSNSNCSGGGKFMRNCNFEKKTRNTKKLSEKFLNAHAKLGWDGINDNGSGDKGAKLFWVSVKNVEFIIESCIKIVRITYVTFLS